MRTALALAVALLVTGSVPSLAAGPRLRLRAGAPHTVPLAAGENLIFELHTTARRPLLLTVEQEGVDVVTHLAAAGDRLMWTFDSPRGRWGDERALIESVRSERLRLELRAGPGAGRGQVHVRLEEHADTSPASLATNRAATRAAQLFTAATPEARREALTEVGRALRSAGEAGLEAEEAPLHHLAAVLQRQRGQLEEATASARLAMVLWQRRGDHRGTALAANELGFLLWQKGEARAARDPLGEALAARRRLGDAHGEVQTLINLALTFQSTGELERATELLTGARARLAAARDPDLEAAVLNNLGGLAMARGRAERALPLFEEVARLSQPAGRGRERAQALINAAAAERQLGRLERALTTSMAALALAVREGDLRSEAAVRSNLGQLLLTSGEARRAVSVLEGALPLRRRLGDRRGEAATLDNLGRALTLLGDHPAAEQAFTTALVIRRETGDRRGEGTTLDHLGQLLVERGALAAARTHFEAALAVRRRLPDTTREARTRCRLASLELATGDPSAARRLLIPAITALRAARDPIGLAEALAALAAVERREENLEKALSLLEESLTLLESLRARLSAEESRAAFLAQVRSTYDQVVLVLVALDRRFPGRGFRERALEASEKLRARSLLDLLLERGEGFEAPPARELAEHIRARAAHHSELVARGGNEAEVAALAAELDVLLTELEALRGPSSDISAPTLDAAAVRALLDADTVLLEFALGEPASHLFVVERSGIEVHTLPPRREIDARARALHTAWRMNAPGDTQSESAEALALARLLLAPAASALSRSSRLAVVADGALHLLPFAALPDPGSAPATPRVLLETHEIVHLPSASVLASLRARAAGRRKPPLAAAILADPQFRRDSGLGRLPASRREALALAALLPPERTLLALGAAADATPFESGRVADAGILHLATHGVIDEKRPALSGIALASGWMHLAELSHLELGAELVVLSGCNTALGRPLSGEGLVGLSRAFCEPGAPGVVASLWQVRDRATAELMTHFYRSHLRDGERVAAALRRAQLAVRTTALGRDPYHWAAFTVQGEWQ